VSSSLRTQPDAAASRIPSATAVPSASAATATVSAAATVCGPCAPCSATATAPYCRVVRLRPTYSYGRAAAAAQCAAENKVSTDTQTKYSFFSNDSFRRYCKLLPLITPNRPDPTRPRSFPLGMKCHPTAAGACKCGSLQFQRPSYSYGRRSLAHSLTPPPLCLQPGPPKAGMCLQRALST
jgi:hypothetical protein